MKTCTKCGQTKPREEFGKASKTKDGLDCWCKICKRAKHVLYYQANRSEVLARNARWAATNPEKAAHANRNCQFKRKHGITAAQRDAMADAQQHKCAICGCIKPKHGGHNEVLQLDHDHDTDVLRELLCFECNTGLGKFEDSVARVVAVLRYLLKHKKNHPLDNFGYCHTS
jgi:hypothetical protein